MDTTQADTRLTSEVRLSQISPESRKYHKALRRVGEKIGLMGTHISAMSHVIGAINFDGIVQMQEQMEAEAIAEITDEMVESVMEKTMMDYDAAKALLVSARLDDLWKEQDDDE